VQREQRSVSIGAAHMHMLAKNRELLGQVAVQLGQLAKARLVINTALVPLLEGVGAAADHRDVQFVGTFDQRVANLRELTQHLR